MSRTRSSVTVGALAWITPIAPVHGKARGSSASSGATSFWLLGGAVGDLGPPDRCRRGLHGASAWAHALTARPHATSPFQTTDRTGPESHPALRALRQSRRAFPDRAERDFVPATAARAGA